jgi:hypothetical protein
MTHSSNPFRGLFKYVYLNFRELSIAAAEFLVISTETTCWETGRE